MEPSCWKAVQEKRTINWSPMFLNDVTQMKKIIQIPKKQSDVFRLMIWNVHSWSSFQGEDSMQAIFELIVQCDPDVLCLQEVSLNSNFKALTEDNLQQKFESLGYTYQRNENSSFFLACNLHGPSHQFGNLIVSKIPPKQREIHVFHSQRENRVAGYISVPISTDLFLNIWNTHLDVYDHSEETRLNQVKSLLEHPLHSNSTVVVGDFNCVNKNDYNEEEWKILTKLLEYSNFPTPLPTLVSDYFHSHGFQTSFEKSKISPPKFSCLYGRLIDMIWIPDHFPLKVVNSGVIPSLASDHLPIFADFLLPSK